eukprot:g50615.t1
MLCISVSLFVQPSLLLIFYIEHWPIIQSQGGIYTASWIQLQPHRTWHSHSCADKCIHAHSRYLAMFDPTPIAEAIPLYGIPLQRTIQMVGLSTIVAG